MSYKADHHSLITPLISARGPLWSIPKKLLRCCSEISEQISGNY